MTTAEALAAGDFDEALRQLLELWDRHRSPGLAAMIEDVSAHVTMLLAPLEPGESRQHVAVWIAMARAKRPSDVGRLLAWIKFPALLAIATIPQAEELMTLAPDPRIARILVKMVEPHTLAMGNGADSKVFTRALKGLAVHADPRFIDSIATFANAPYYSRTSNARQLTALAESWRKRWPTSPKDPAELAALEGVDMPDAIATVARPARTAESLLAEIYARPDDDAPRLVYADLLGERGDPRSEFITLQLAPSTPAAKKRAAALLAEHRTAWLGSLAGSVTLSRTEWARGFPVATRPSVTKRANPEAAFGREEWATFERIDFGGTCVLSETMRGLRAATGVPEAALRKLGPFAPPLEELELELDRGRELRISQPTIKLALARFPKLRSLTLTSPMWKSGESLLEIVAALAPRLSHFAVHGPGVAGYAVTGLIAADASGLASFGWGELGRYFVVRRGADGKLAQPIVV